MITKILEGSQQFNRYKENWVICFLNSNDTYIISGNKEYRNEEIKKIIKDDCMKSIDTITIQKLIYDNNCPKFELLNANYYE